MMIACGDGALLLRTAIVPVLVEGVGVGVGSGCEGVGDDVVGSFTATVPLLITVNVYVLVAPAVPVAFKPAYGVTFSVCPPLPMPHAYGLPSESPVTDQGLTF